MYRDDRQPQNGRAYTQTEVPAANVRHATHGYHQPPSSWDSFGERSNHAPQGTHGYGGPNTPSSRDPSSARSTLDYYYQQKELERQRMDEDRLRHQKSHPQQQQSHPQPTFPSQQQQQQQLHQEQLQEQYRQQLEEADKQRQLQRKQEEERQRQMQDLRQAQLKEEEEQKWRQERLMELRRQEELRKAQAVEEERRLKEEHIRLQQQQQQRQQEQEHQQQQNEIPNGNSNGNGGNTAIQLVLKAVDNIRLKYEAAAFTPLSTSGEQNKQRTTYIELLNGQIDKLDMVDTAGCPETKAARKTAVNGIIGLQNGLDSYIEREASLFRLHAQQSVS
eukprot:TRINITY_DN8971_c0_g2_i1.p1 TRINITY_DN8971_c0_g2~~TRINITY_DN8971_c0_g2_i1.p1  ORF type:complete len:333 (+),score=92.64 TRINITY_DN8971_c0_g2_i1:37-1035(+)